MNSDIADSMLAPLETHDLQIGGTRSKPSSGLYFQTDNPCSGEVWANVARGSKADVDRAVEAAAAALPVWNRMRPAERGTRMMRIADLVERDAQRLATLEVRDNGKLYAEMFGQVRLVADWFRYYGGLADKLEGAVIPTGKPDMLTFTRYEPLGVVALITPWNSPLLLLTHKLATALAAGNVAVIKPSEHASVSTLAFAELFTEAGFPGGVINVVTGFGHEAGAALTSHPGIAKIAFTGSESGGQRINEAAAPDFKHVALELGGKSPNIVFDDADLEAAVVGAIAGIFAASGQTCIAGSRLLLQRPIHDRFVEALVKIAAEARIGDPMNPETHVGPIATQAQFEKVLDYIDLAKREGAHCALGGGPYRGTGSTGRPICRSDHFHRRSQSDADRARGGLRSRAVDHSVRHRRAGFRDRQRHPLRSCRRCLDLRYRPGAARIRALAGRDHMGQHLSRGRPFHAVRRLQAQRSGA
jgi:acyl-CoA reductase-like NAD-dependent aldehyde dehydrogenase